MSDNAPEIRDQQGQLNMNDCEFMPLSLTPMEFLDHEHVIVDADGARIATMGCNRERAEQFVRVANEHAALLAERDALVKALEPFAEFAETFGGPLPDEYEFLVKLDAVPLFKAKIGDFRRARAALNHTPQLSSGDGGSAAK